MLKYKKRVMSLIFASALILNLLQTSVYAEDGLNAFRALSDDALHNYTVCSQWTNAYHKSYCSECQKYILRPHTFAVVGGAMTCTGCGYSTGMMVY